MASTSINVEDLGIDCTRTDNTVLVARSDMRIAIAGFVVAVLIAIAGIVVFMLPINDSMKVAFTPLGVLFLVIAGYSAIIYEALCNSVFAVTNDHVEERGGVLWKIERRIPLAYVRDVTYSQTLVQTILGVSSVSVCPTNGNKIVFSNIAGGQRIRDIIWELVLKQSREPGAEPHCCIKLFGGLLVPTDCRRTSVAQFHRSILSSSAR